VFRVDQTPNSAAWELTTLYKPAAIGGQLQWTVGFDGIDHLIMKSGHVGGIIESSRTEVKLNTSGRLMQEQALLDARQRYNLKYHEGYQPLGDDTPRMIVGMKGDEYKEGDIKSWPVYTQIKFDGIRMLVNYHKGVLMPRSWRNNSYSHIIKYNELMGMELKEFFAFLPVDTTLDGELFNRFMTFNEISSAVKTVKSAHADIKIIQYWIFDIDYLDPAGTPYEKRYETLVSAYRAYIQSRSPNNNPEDYSARPLTFCVVPSTLTYSHEKILAQNDEYYRSGFEGVMIKRCSNGAAISSKQYNMALYREGKHKNIMKYKYSRDEEGTIIGVTESEGTEKGLALLTVRDPRGNIIEGMRMKGSFARRKDWFLHPEKVIGKELTYTYQDLSEYGVPRFPRGKAIRDYE
jgi:DNA ligase-1